MIYREEQEQIALMEWAEFFAHSVPELSLLFHIPNGGKRNAVEAARFKAMGVKAGVPDLFLPVARGGKHGLFVEMKARGGKTRDSQKGWLDALSAQGYETAVCFGWDEAREKILKYLKQKDRKL